MLTHSLTILMILFNVEVERRVSHFSIEDERHGVESTTHFCRIAACLARQVLKLSASMTQPSR